MSYDIKYTYRIINKYSSVITDINKDTEKFSENLEKVAKDIDKVSKKSISFKHIGHQLSYVGERLSKTFSLASGAMAGMAFHTAGEYYDAMDKIRLITGKTEEQMGSLDKMQKQLSTTSLSTIEEMGKASLLMNQRGLDPEKVMPYITELKTAIGSDLTDNINLVITAMQQWDLQYSDLPFVMDQVTASIEKSGGNVQDLSQAWFMGAAAAKQAGMSMTDYNAALTVYKRTGGSASEAASDLIQVQRTLGNQLEKQHIHGKNLKGLVEILEAVNQKHLTLGQKQELFGRQGAMFITRMQSQVEELKKMEKEMANAQGITDKFAKDELGDLNNQFQRLHQSYQSLELAIIKPDMVETVSKLLGGENGKGGLVGVINSFSSSHVNDSWFSIIRWIIMGGMVIGPALLTLGKMFEAIFVLKELNEAFHLTRVATSMLTGGFSLLLTPEGLVIMAVLSLGIAFYELYKHCKKFHDFVDKLISKMVGLSNALNITSTATSIIHGKSVSTTSFKPMTQMTSGAVSMLPVNPIGSLMMMLAQHFTKPQQLMVDINVNDKNNMISSVYPKSTSNSLTSSVQRGNNMPHVGAF
jgi:TP901 family phage tail tape measure protein